VPLGPGSITVTIIDMERKWDINMVATRASRKRRSCKRPWPRWGVTDAEQSSTIIDSILDWVNPNESSGYSGAKNDYYMHLNPPYYCKNGPIDDISELLLIKGITPEIYWGSNSTNHPFPPTTAWQRGLRSTHASRNGVGFHGSDQPQYPVGLVELFCAMGGKLNVNTASVKTLQLVPGLDEATAQHIIEQRAGPDGQDGNDDDARFRMPARFNGGLPGGGGANVPGAPPTGPAAQSIANYVDVHSYVFDIKIDAEINGYKRTFHGIISRGGNGGQQFVCVKFYWE